MGKPHRAAVVGILMSLSMLLAACAPAGDDGTDPQATSTTAAGTESQTISFQLYQRATHMSPLHSVQGADHFAAFTQFLSLITFVDGEYVERLAESWETEDNQHYTFVLNEAQWSDGTPITSDDVKFSLERYLNPQAASVWAGYLSGIEGSADLAEGATELSGFEAIDDKTFEITLSDPNPAFLANLTEIGIIPKSVYESVPADQMNGHALFYEPTVGSGAYLFSKWIDDDTLEFVKNPNALYQAQADRLILKYLSGDVAVAQVQTGEVDIAEVPATEVDELASAGIKTITHPGTRVMTLHTSMPSGKLADRRVRQAIMYAIDREAIIDSVLAGKGRTVGSMMFQPDWAQSPDQNDYAYDPEKAKELLAEADWDASTEVNLDIVPGQADRDAVVRIIVGQLQEAGINAVIRQHQAADLTNYVNNYELDLLITPYTQTVPEPSGLNSRLMCATRTPNGPNITGYCNEDLDRLLLEGAAAVEQDQRAEIYQEVTKILNEEVVQFPLYVADLNAATTETIQGYDNRVWPPTAIADHWSK